MLIKVVLLAMWAAAVDLWIAKHFHSGLGFDEVLILLGVPLGSAWFTGVFDFFIDPESQKTVKGYLRGWIQRQLNYRVLGLLYLGFTVFALTYSSLSITAIKPAEERVISLRPLSAPEPVTSQTDKLEQTLDMHLFINPFSSQYELEVTGFLPKVVSIKPITGTVVIPERDLQKIPTVLFRPTPRSYTLLGSGGWFELYQRQNGQFLPAAEDQGTHAWFIGPRRQQPGMLLTNWRLEAEAIGFTGPALATLVLRWRNPRAMILQSDTGPDDVMCALVSNVDRNRFMAGVVVTLGRDEYIDIPLEDLTNEMPASINTGSAVCQWLFDGAS